MEKEYYREDAFVEPVEKPKKYLVKEKSDEFKRNKIIRLMVEEGLSASEAVKIANCTLEFYYKQLLNNEEFRDSVQFAEEFTGSLVELAINRKIQHEVSNISVGGDIKTARWYAEHRMPEYRKNMTTTHEVGKTLFDFLKKTPEKYEAKVIEKKE